jgi:hypothetical protein
VTDHDPNRRLDRGIERAVWMTHGDIVARTSRLRSPMVTRCIDDYLAGRRYPLDLVCDFIREATVSTSEPGRLADTLRAIDTRR